jgi:hypothetical protein
MRPKREEIQKVVRQVYDSLTARSVIKATETAAQRQERIAQGDTRFQQAAIQLSEMILGPAAAELGTKRLVVIADGALQYVPFSALPAISGPSTNKPLTTYRPLILDHEVAVFRRPQRSPCSVRRWRIVNSL